MSNEKNNLISPYDGSPLLSKGDGLFYSEYNNFLYMVNTEGKVITIQSSLTGAPLVPKGDGLFYSEYDKYFYKVDDTGKIIPLESPITCAPLLPFDDGTFYCEYENEFYKIDDTGKIIPIFSKEENVHTTLGDNNNESTNDITNIENAIECNKIRIGEVNQEIIETKGEIQQELNKTQNERA